MRLRAVWPIFTSLAEVASRKTLSFRERKMFDHARALLVFEVAEVERRTVAEVQIEVEEALGRHAKSTRPS